MINFFRIFMDRFFGFTALFFDSYQAEWDKTSALAKDTETDTRMGEPVAYDEYLLEKSRTQWQFGDWNSLAKLDRETL
ncbi:MAG: hypothetical protein ACR2HF_00380, partial [Methylococcaceae bacterium]